jgi:hypothetical protein
MSANASSKAYDAMKAALAAHVARFRAMDTPSFVKRCAAMWHDAEPEIGRGGTLGKAMERLAALGSIEACAALAVMGVGEKRVITALRAVAERSPDVVEGCKIEALAMLFEEWADEEVKAGRMTVAIGEGGVKLYSTVRGKDSSP